MFATHPRARKACHQSQETIAEHKRTATDVKFEKVLVAVVREAAMNLPISTCAQAASRHFFF